MFGGRIWLEHYYTYKATTEMLFNVGHCEKFSFFFPSLCIDSLNELYSQNFADQEKKMEKGKYGIKTSVCQEK